MSPELNNKKDAPSFRKYAQKNYKVILFKVGLSFAPSFLPSFKISIKV
jgi:hypothetical protein